jgi:DNA-directed RNA polymerase specialized sigma subunit
MRSLTQKTDFFDAIEYVEDILKDWDIYRLIIEDVGNYPGIEKYRKAAHIMKCIENRHEFLSKKECAYLELKYFKKKNYQEIAKRLNIKPRTVANWRIRILYKIAKRGALI